MISSYESHREAGLEVARGALSRSLAAELEADCEYYMSLQEDHRPIALERVAYEGRRAANRKFTSNELIEIGRPATAIVLNGLNRAEDYLVAINHQPPGTYQGFHPDPTAEAPVIVVHASPDGIFDFHPTATSSTKARVGFSRIKQIGSGDIVGQFKPGVFHRGGNPSTHDRYNLVIYRLMSQF